MKYIILLLFLLGGGAVWGTMPREVAFGSGEELAYVVSYKVGFANTDVARVTMNTVLTSSGTVYDIEASGRVYPAYRWFFDLNDVYRSRLDAQTLRPIDLQIELSEGKYRVSASYRYDWERMRVNTSFHNHKKPAPSVRTLPLLPKSFDGLALFYNLRCMEAASLIPGKLESLDMVLEDTVRKIYYRFLGRENKSIKGLGKFKTLKFSCQLATSEGESFEDGSEMTLWISDDGNKIPLYLESPIRVGSIRARLVSAKNLKFAMSSKIK